MHVDLAVELTFFFFLQSNCVLNGFLIIFKL